MGAEEYADIELSYWQHVWILSTLILISLFGLLALDPIPQDPDYHLFADGRTFFRIPNFYNVVSNIGFAVYYMRALEIPTPRWTTFDTAFFKIDRPKNAPATLQDRAYTSPIWYTLFCLASVSKSGVIQTMKTLNSAVFSFIRLIPIALIFLTLFSVSISGLSAQQKEGVSAGQSVAQTSADFFQMRPVRTESPRDTMATFLRLRSNLETAMLSYLQDATREKADYIQVLIGQFVSLIDLSTTPRASRREVGRETMAYLLDIMGRVEPLKLDDVPLADALAAKDGARKWRVPGTPIYIARIAEGSREGEFLFSERAIRVAPRFFNGIRSTPLRSPLGIESWHVELLQNTGPLIPGALVHAIPDSLKKTWYGTPIWKVLAVFLLSILGAFLVRLVHSFVAGRETDRKIVSFIWRLLKPVSIIVFVMVLRDFIDFELIISGAFSSAVNFIETLLIFLALAWIFWIAIRIFFEWLILSPRIPDESLDANLLRLVSAFLGIVGVTIVLAVGGEKLGLPVLSLLAGLGIGGIAVALAIRPTLENLIGGVILYIDKPVRVGDLCSFDDKIGRVESIGVRSTQFRALDRTLISIPNAHFVDMNIANWAKCDQMLIEETIGLRYETSPDQLRYVLVKLRETFHAHPCIDNNTVRVRFSGYGESSLDVTIRIYAKTRDRNEFHAIREDILMRTYDVVEEAGTGFAFPSRTLYMGQDEGLDKKRTSAAVKKVEAWRRSGRLPFPSLPTDMLKEIEDTLDYPPRGSPEASGDEQLNPDGTKRPSTKRPRSKDDDETVKGSRPKKHRKR